MYLVGKKYRIYLFVCFGIGGVLCAQLTHMGVLFVLLVTTLAALVCLLFRARAVWVVALVFFVCAFIRADMWMARYSEPSLPEGVFSGQIYIAAEPDKREYNTRYVARVLGSHEQILITTSHFPEFVYGDVIHLNGDLVYPRDFETDTGRVFRYSTFLQKDKIYYQMRYPEMVLLSQGTKGHPVLHTLLDIKHALITRFSAGGATLGGKIFSWTRTA